MGIRKKTLLGFVCLVVMLAFSGTISLIELNQMGQQTTKILETSSHTLELSKGMLDAVQEQNSYLLSMIASQSTGFDQGFIDASNEFEKRLREASELETDPEELKLIYDAKKDYYKLVSDFFDEHVTTDVNWFINTYRTSYRALTGAIKNYMTNSQHILLDRATQLKSNAYRAMMPGIITLLTAIVMVLMFAFLLDLYYTRPFMKINTGLNNYLKLKLPFNVTTEGKDEISQIKNNIEQLIALLKEKK
jgi:CHASE3 domain sensor protein